jgi:vacuolar-type H+-ATPase subunit I/STV1
MLTAEAMELVTIAVLKEKAESVVSRLLKSGVFHPVDIRGIEAGMRVFHNSKWKKSTRYTNLSNQGP